MARVSTGRSMTSAPRFQSLLQEEFAMGGRILNLGAGSGVWTDASRVVVNLDHVLVLRHSGALQVTADANALPFRACSFTGILAKDVLEHLADPLHVLSTLHDLVHPRGLLIATVPRAVPRAVWDDPTHVRGFTANAVRTALDATGWRLLSLGRIGGLPGAGRLGLTPHLERIMRIPGIGHRFGLNWLIRAEPSSE